MSIIDSFKFSLKKTIRNKGNIFFSIILIIGIIVMMATISFRTIFITSINNTINNMIEFRKLIIFPDKESIANGNINYDKLKEVSHIVDYYDMKYNIFDVSIVSSLGSDYNGMLELVYGSKNNLIPTIAGRQIEENESGVAICSNHFFPSLELNDKSLRKLSSNDILSSTFSINVPIYKQHGDNLIKTDEMYKKNFQIVGLFSSEANNQWPYVCYISPNDMKDLYDSTSTFEIDGSYLPKLAIVDDVVNIEYTMKELQAKGFDVKIQSYYDETQTNNIKNICNLTLLITILTISVLTILYVKKKSINNYLSYNIQKALGYSINDIKKNSFFEILILLLIAFIIGTILFELIYRLIYYMYYDFIIFNTYNYERYAIAYIFTFVVNFVIVLLFNHISLAIYLKKNKFSKS